MATRRSRIQARPNIGARGPAASQTNNKNPASEPTLATSTQKDNDAGKEEINIAISSWERQVSAECIDEQPSPASLASPVTSTVRNSVTLLYDESPSPADRSLTKSPGVSVNIPQDSNTADNVAKNSTDASPVQKASHSQSNTGRRTRVKPNVNIPRKSETSTKLSSSMPEKIENTQCESKPQIAEKVETTSSVEKMSNVAVKPTTGRRSRIKPVVQVSAKTGPASKVSLISKSGISEEKASDSDNAHEKTNKLTNVTNSVQHVEAITPCAKTEPISDKVNEEQSKNISQSIPDFEILSVVGDKDHEKTTNDITDITIETVTLTVDQTLTSEGKDLLISPAAKPITKRGRFMKARPNIAAVEKRRARLTSVSDVEDSPVVKRQRLASISQAGEPPIVRTTAETDGEGDIPTVVEEFEIMTSVNQEPVEAKPKKPRARRRVSVKLGELVSENRSKFTIGDLIHMNPSINQMKRYTENKDPIPPKGSRNNNEETEDIDSLGSRASTPSLPESTRIDQSEINENSNSNSNSEAQQTLRELNENENGENIADGTNGGAADKDDEEDVMAPRVMIGPDGNIIVNSTSLVVDNPANQADISVVEGDVVIENDNYDPSFYYKKQERGAYWTIKETTKFYVALSTVGTDFSLMSNLFPKRSRLQLKRKFKIEERKHKELIDRTLAERRELDMSIFDLSSEDESPQGENDENLPTEISSNKKISHIVKKELQKEKESKGKKKKTTKNPKNVKKPKEKDKQSEVKEKKTQKKTPKSVKSKTKPKRKKVGSNYYDESSEESDAPMDVEKLDVDKGDADPANKDQVSVDKDPDQSESDDCIVQNTTPAKTRSGRQPKRKQHFEAGDPKHTRIDSKLAPLVSLPQPGLSPQILEDQASGSRLLLVKSPPPAGMSMDKNAPSEFVHVYLLSPSARSDTTPNFTPQRPIMISPESHLGTFPEARSGSFHPQINPSPIQPTTVINVHGSLRNSDPNSTIINLQSPWSKRQEIDFKGTHTSTPAHIPNQEKTLQNALVTPHTYQSDPNTAGPSHNQSIPNQEITPRQSIQNQAKTYRQTVPNQAILSENVDFALSASQDNPCNSSPSPVHNVRIEPVTVNNTGKGMSINTDLVNTRTIQSGTRTGCSGPSTVQSGTSIVKSGTRSDLDLDLSTDLTITIVPDINDSQNITDKCRVEDSAKLNIEVEILEIIPDSDDSQNITDKCRVEDRANQNIEIQILEESTEKIMVEGFQNEEKPGVGISQVSDLIKKDKEKPNILYTAPKAESQDTIIKTESQSRTSVIEIFEKAEITTISTEDGQIMEILIDPGLINTSTENEDSFQVYDIEILHKDGDENIALSQIKSEENLIIDLEQDT